MQDIDPKFQGFNNKLKIAGVAVVALLGSWLVAIAAATAAIAAGAVIVALFMINYALPVAAKRITLMRQRAMVQIVEEFSEEVILKDEREEMERFNKRKSDFTAQKSSLQAVIEELNAAYQTARSDIEKEALALQMQDLKDIIDQEQEMLVQASSDLDELQHNNKMIILLSKAAKAKLDSASRQRNAQQMQDLKLARENIKNSFRKSIAVRQMDATLDSAKRTSNQSAPALTNNPAPVLKSVQKVQDVVYVEQAQTLGNSRTRTPS